jgi:glycogen operon protein
VFRRRRWFQGRAIHGNEVKDIAWFTPAGDQMAEEDWETSYAKSLGIFLNGKSIPNPYPMGEPVEDDSFLLLINAHHEGLTFRLPAARWGAMWEPVIDTAGGWVDTGKQRVYPAATEIRVEARAMILFSHVS